jgi:adenine-specific DNA-methyltransferase
MPTLHWIGKDKVVSHHQDVPYRVLEHKYGFTAENGDQTQPTNSGNKIIHGDNLEALKSLLPEYEGKIKCIYIDPPYNTGNEKWVYNDNVNHPKIKKWLGEVVGKDGEDLSRHDKWLCMMYPRLKLLHKLLADDGVIFISIDDNEQANLKLLCDEIFGSWNFLGNILWKKKTNGNNMGHIPAVHDFFVCYAKKETLLNLPGFPLGEDYLNKNYKNPDNDPRGPWKTTDLSANHKGPYFAIENPKTKELHYPPKGRYWVFNEAEVLKRIKDGRIIFGKTGKTKPVQKKFLKNKNKRKKPESWWDNHGFNSDGMTTLSKILGTKVFDHPKPYQTISHIINISTSKNDTILDSFAGSGTTAHAVLNLNKQDGGNRKFILVEMEDYADNITAERVKRVAKGYGKGKKVVAGIGGSFDYYELGLPLFDESQNLNEVVGLSKIREYIWFSETRTSFTEPQAEPYLLGKKDESVYYFIYEKDRLTTLDFDALELIKTRGEQYVIYADNCLLPQAFMARHNIIFKKIPRDITRF